MKVAEALVWGEKMLAASGVAEPKMDAAWILAAELEKQIPLKAHDLFLANGERISVRESQNFKRQIQRRARRIPLAYLLRSQEFMGLSFFMDENVLVPRQETEILVEAVLSRAQHLGSPQILEIGTGSGNISISLAKNLSGSKILSLEISASALRVARKNVRLHRVEETVSLQRGDLFPEGQMQFDLIVSNPPYVQTAELRNLQKEISWEPRVALDGGADGLRVIEPIVRKSVKYLRAAGRLFLEMGFDQARAVAELLKSSGFCEIEIVPDYAGIKRVAIGVKNG